MDKVTYTQDAESVTLEMAFRDAESGADTDTIGLCLRHELVDKTGRKLTPKEGDNVRLGADSYYTVAKPFPDFSAWGESAPENHKKFKNEIRIHLKKAS